MKPIYLEMTAFGCFAKKTAVAFDQLRHGLYLVSGDTGAGKTTIFDAIVFALYGEVSGSERKADMMHSDFVSKAEDTVVTLRFEQGGRTYQAERRLHFAKRRSAGEDQYGEGKISAFLLGPDQEATEGAGKVTQRCEELLGLNAQQFRKIIMLAQGEFREFLQADSDKKNEILGKLFDNAPYLWYVNLLDSARNVLRDRRAMRQEELNTLMRSVFRLPAGISDEERLLYLPGHPALYDNLRELTGKEETELCVLREKRDALQQALNTLNAQKGAAETFNALLAELTEKRLHMTVLKGREQEDALRASRLEVVQRAVRQVLPAARTLRQAQKALEQTKEDITSLRGQLAEREKDVTLLNAKAEEDQQVHEELTRTESLLSDLEAQLPLYDQLEAQLKSRDAAVREAARAGQEALKAEQERAKAEQAAGTLRTTLEQLDHADAEALSARHAHDECVRRLEGLTGEKGLLRSVGEIRRQEALLIQQQMDLTALSAREMTAQQEYFALYRSFIGGQAGILAEQVREEIREKGETACPVCGTALCSRHLPGLAALSEETPTQAQVDQAKGRWEQAEKNRSAQLTQVKTLQERIGDRQQNAVRDAALLLEGADSWELLCRDGFLDEAAQDARKEEKASAQALRDALERAARRQEAKKRLPEFEEKQKTLSDRRDQEARTQQAQEAAAQTAAAHIERLSAQLKEPTRGAALTKKEQLEKRSRLLKAQTEAYQNALTQARKAQDTARGALTEREKTASRQEQEAREYSLELERVLKENRFSSLEEVRGALASLQGMDGESWIAREQKALQDTDFDRQLTASRIRELEKQTAGKEWTDMAGLNALILAKGQETEEAAQRCSDSQNLLEHHREVTRRAGQLISELSATDGAWKRISVLADLAVGVNSPDGKLSFDRYVMGAVFRDILEMANMRLDRMSGGRYELVHKIGSERKNSKSGLELEVLDNSTGQRRPSGSLSGGESFFTSLSLALGLSDVVQNRAGGRQLDALFIDEGFGTLSDGALDKALEVLTQLTEGDRLVGIISHVDKLGESIPQKILVRAGEQGSTVRMEI